MGRRPCCEKVGLNRGPWTVEEDLSLTNFILNHGIHCWRLVPKLAGLQRCGKSCRLRWVNYLRPDLKKGPISDAEEAQIIQLHSRFGNRWSKIAAHFPGRTDNEIKNHWNTRIKKKLKQSHEQVADQHPSSPVENKMPIQPSSSSSNQSTTYSTESENDTFWQSIEMELTCSSSTSSHHENTTDAPIQEEAVQNWIGCLESLLFSDGMHQNPYRD